MKPISEMTNEELDKAIAVEVIGWEVKLRYCSNSNECGYWEETEEYIEWLKKDDIKEYEYQQKLINDRIIVRKLCRVEHITKDCYEPFTKYTIVESFTESIADAWKVIERMRELRWWYDICAYGEDETMVQFGYMDEEPEEDFAENAFNKSAPRAICEAALAAVRESA